MRKHVTLLLSFLFPLLLVGCTIPKNEDILVNDITPTIIADERFAAKVYENINKDAVIVVLTNNFGEDIQDFTLEATHYNAQNEVMDTATIDASYLMSNHSYYNQFPVNWEHEVVKVEVRVVMNESESVKPLGGLYTDQIATHGKINDVDSIRYEIHNNSDMVIIDCEIVIVYFIEEQPVYLSFLDISEMPVNSNIEGGDSIALVVTREEGIEPLQADDVIVHVNYAR